LFVLTTTLVGRAESLENAQRARAMLGPNVWARVIRVENVAERSRYPEIVHAVIFELGGVLWFYTDTDGTQSFSLHRHNLAAEKADLAPLLREIEPGFVRWDVVPANNSVIEPAGASALPNGCLIESFLAARQLEASGAVVRNAQLVSFYADVGGILAGHTVLAYEGKGGAYLIDPNEPGRRIRIGRRLPDKPLDVVRNFKIAGVAVTKARSFTIPPIHAPSVATAISAPREDKELLMN
jgi:hypothetical protein